MSRATSPATVYDDEPLIARMTTTGSYVIKYNERGFKAMVTRIPLDLGDRSLWIFDSGATSHFTYDQSSYVSYQEIEPLPVGTADKVHTMDAIGIGIVVVTFTLNGKMTRVRLHDVLHVPLLQSNLLSHPKLAQRGYCTYSDMTHLYLLNGRTPFGWAELKRNHWILEMEVANDSANLANAKRDVSQTIQVWHRHLAHVSVDRVKELARNEEVSGLLLSSSMATSKCEACILGKMPVSRTLGRTNKAVSPGDVIHSDLEFMGHKSLSGAEISLKFLDEYSNYLWVYSLNSKEANVILTFWKQICALFMTQFSTRIKALHTDNGLEFVNNEMKDFNSQNGIEHHLTVPYRHKMNGRIERMNRTGSDAVRSMLEGAGLPRGYLYLL
ncbi:hypothetical protein ACEPAG_7557 [Sanghuangporus baumii]